MNRFGLPIASLSTAVRERLAALDALKPSRGSPDELVIALLTAGNHWR